MTSQAADVAWIHGYTMSDAIWEELWARLPGLRHQGVELPGHGRRVDVAMPSSLGGLGADVAAQVHASGARVLVGLSYGSCVALQTALDHPGLVERLVLAAPTLAGRSDDPEAAAKYFLLARQLHTAGPGPRMARLWMADPPRIFTGLRDHPAAYVAMERVVSAHPFHELRTGAMGRLHAARHTDDDLRGLRTPTTVIIGTEDMPAFQENAARLARLVPDCEVLEVPGTGHLPLLERPAECAELLDNRLAAAQP